MKWRYPMSFWRAVAAVSLIARALVLKPKVLFLDEPAIALSTTTQMRILWIYWRFARSLELVCTCYTCTMWSVVAIWHIR